MAFLVLMTGFAGFVDSAAGGGGLISLPAYLFAGLPPHYTLSLIHIFGPLKNVIAQKRADLVCIRGAGAVFL